MHQSAPDRLDPKTLILVWDIGASAGLMPFWSDFIAFVECEIDVCDITKVNKVVGIGTTLHKFMDNNGNHVTCHVCLTIFQRGMSGCLHLLVRFRSVNLVSWLGLNRDLPKLDKFS